MVGAQSDEINLLAANYVRRQKELADSSAEGKERSLRRKLDTIVATIESVRLGHFGGQLIVVDTQSCTTNNERVHSLSVAILN